MKKLFLITLLSIAALTVKAQGTLQFNRVLTVSTTVTTVPTGKVWKVTNYFQATVTYINSSSSAETACTNPGIRIHPLVINGKNYFINNNGNITTGLGVTVYLIPAYNELPLWMAAGSTIATVCTDDFATIIEFNIIP